MYLCDIKESARTEAGPCSTSLRSRRRKHGNGVSFYLLEAIATAQLPEDPDEDVDVVEPCVIVKVPLLLLQDDEPARDQVP